MNQKKTRLGLDLGIGSVGWCLYQTDEENNPERIIDLGSFVFDQIEDGKTGKTENIDRREKRSMRRQRRRRVRRLKDCRFLFLNTFGIEFESIIANKSVKESPFEIKRKGLDQKLTKEELCVALYHYCKYRGFKSNRKVDLQEKPKSAEDGKMLKGIADLRKEMASVSASNRPTFVTEMLLARNEGKSKYEKRLHNSSTDYNLTVERSMYLAEIEYLLDTQIRFGVIDEKFKNEYIKLFSRQRDFSEGPDASSKYHVDLDKFIGRCELDHQPRAPKESISARRFILLSALANLRYKTVEDTSAYKGFTSEEIRAVEKMAIEKKNVTYANLFKFLGINVLQVKGLSISKKKYKKLVHDFKEEKGIEHDSYAMTPEQSEEFARFVKNETLKTVFFKNSDLYIGLKGKLEKISEAKTYVERPGAKASGSEAKAINERVDGFFDKVSEILLRNKTDERIKAACEEEGWPLPIVDAILECKDCTAVINLSLDICRKVAEPLRNGKTYDKALEEIGYKHSVKDRNGNGFGEVPHIPEINEALTKMGVRLTNPVVRHTLVQMRKVVNAVIDTYGCPDSFSIELARELKKNFQERMDVRNEQLESQEGNIREKTEILEKFGPNFATITSVNRDALLRYKLYKQQGGYSPYTNQPIRIDKIFDGKEYQIDHILPYSRSFDDSFNNKVLVETFANQEKRSRTPLEWNYKNCEPLYAYLRAHYLPIAKQNHLLAKEISDDFISKDLNDTSYLSRLTKQLIEFYLLPEGKFCQTVPGGVTSNLRKLWGISGRVHSYLSSHDNELYKGKFITEYLFKKLEYVEEKSKETLRFVFDFRGSEFPLEFGMKKPKEGSNKKLTDEEQIYNDNFETFIQNLPFFENRFMVCKCEGRTINELYQAINYQSVNDADSRRREAGIYVLGLVFNGIQKDINQKNRDNDLHHALDAAVIGAVTPTIIKRFAEFNKNREEAVDQETGEIIICPQPYDDFREEVLTRVYERDQEKLLGYLNALPIYEEHPLTKKDVHVLWPVRLPKKDVVGAVSKETIYGVDRLSGALTQRISVDKLTDKNVENIIDKNGGNNAVYLACKEWLDSKKKNKYPTLNKKGSPIKSVKIVVAASSQGRVDLSNGRFADNDLVVRTDVYKKNTDDETIYMVPVYYYQIFKEKSLKAQDGQRGSDVDYTIMWKQGDDGKRIITGKELCEHYHKVASLPPQSLIWLETTSGNGFAYSGGCTGGKFEIYSLLGDSTDLVSNGLVNLLRDRYQITISTFKKISVHSITVLGKIY